MTQETTPPRHEWIDKLFEDKQSIPPKHRDLLAMLASSLMGNPDAAQHFYNRAIVDGATDQELARMVAIGQAAGITLDASAATKPSSEPTPRTSAESDANAPNPEANLNR
ncbi:MAG: carboxymuconolactone decarboxylase family protein [Chloroflexi bacterium]|nr:carboxymuconolactone decarboxylase family protein [Chloroflexota bacterium]